MERGSESLVGSEESNPAIWDCQTSAPMLRTLQNYESAVTCHISVGTPRPVDNTPGVSCVPINLIRRNDRTQRKLFPATTGLGW